MPIPGSNIDDNAPRFHRTMQHSSNTRKQKNDYSSSQMQPVHRGKHVDERTARSARKVKTSSRENAPGEKLSGKKHQPENSGQREPRKTALVAERMPGIDFTGASAASRVISRRASSIVTLLAIRTTVLASNNAQGKRTGTQTRM